MLEYIADEERREKMQWQIDKYKEMLLLGTITQEVYEYEMMMLADESETITQRKAKLNGQEYALDDMFDCPMNQVDELVKEAHEIYNKRVHKAIDEVLEGEVQL